MGSRGPEEPRVTGSARSDRPHGAGPAAPTRPVELSREAALLQLQRTAGNDATTWLVGQLASASAEFDSALEAPAPAGITVPVTAAGAVIIEAVAAAGRTGREGIVAAARSGLAELQAADAGLKTQLSAADGATVAGLTAAGGQGGSAVATSVTDTRAQIAVAARAGHARIAAWSAETVPAAAGVVAGHAGRTRAAGREHARQTGVTGTATEQRELTTVRSAAAVLGRRTDRQVPGVSVRTARAAGVLRRAGSRLASAVMRQTRPLTQTLTRTATSAAAAVGEVTTATSRQAAEAGAGARDRLAAAAGTATGAVHARAAEIRGARAAATAEAVSALTGAVRQALAASVRREQATTARIARLRAAPATVRRAAEELAGQVAAGHAGDAAGLRRGGSESAARLRDSGSALTSELGSVGAEVQAALGEGAARSVTAVRSLVAPAGQGADAVVAKATATGAEAVARTDRQLADAVGAADAGLGRVTADVRTDLGEHEAQVSGRAAALLPRGGRTTGPAVQRDVPPRSDRPTDRSWFGGQLADLKDMITDPGLLAGAAVTVGLFLALPLALPAAAVAGIALVVGGIVGGIVSALWSGGGDILRSALIGGLVGLGFFLGGLALSALGLTGLALLGGVMLLGALIGIVVNLATGQRWDKGLLANLVLAGVLHEFSRWVQSRRAGAADPADTTRQPKPDEPTAKPDDPGGQERPEPKQDESTREPRQEEKPPPAVSALRRAVVERAEKLIDQIQRLRQRLDNTTRPAPELARALERDALAARDVLSKVDKATDSELAGLDRQLETLKGQGYNREVGVLRAEAADWVEAAERRVAALRGRIPPKNLPRPPNPSRPGVNRADPVALRQGMEEATRAVRELRRGYGKAMSQTALETIKKQADRILVRLKELELTNEELLLPPTLEAAGVSAAAAEAMRLVDVKERDPLGDLHRAPADDRHFGAARREANGDVVATKQRDASGKPWSHVNDIQNARNAVAGARATIIAELEQQPRDLTPYGRSKLQEQAAKAGTMLTEVDQFLAEIGWPADRPFQWVRDRGRWVPAADVNQMRAMAGGQLNEVAAALQDRATTGTIREIRITDPTLATALETRRAGLLADVTREQAGIDAVRTEAQVTAFRQVVEGLQRRWRALYEDIHLSRVR